jgi:DNA-binding CsgD family transcriptional regulator
VSAGRIRRANTIYGIDASRHAETGRFAGRRLGPSGSRQRRRQGDARDDCGGIFLDKGRLAAAGCPDILQKLIVSCAQTTLALGGPGGELKIPRELPRSLLVVTVTPLRSKARLADVPWIGVGTPVAIVTVRDPDIDRRRREINLRRRFGLTIAESKMAAEILIGDGRAAAARRRGISNATAKTHLSSIFDKTGTHRQAELIRLLLHAADENKTDI